MEYKIILFTCVAYLCQVQSQFCVNPGTAPQLVANTPLVAAPKIINTPVIATKFVDNSISSALANVLQLLIVSDLIQSKLGSSCLSNGLLNSLKPVIDSIAPLYPPAVPIGEYITPCHRPLEAIPPYVPVVESVLPNCYGGVTETIYPSSYGVTEQIIPNYFGGCTDILIQTPNPYSGLTEYISTTPFVPNTCLPEVVAPTCGLCYGGATELVTTYPYNPYGCGCGVSEIIPTPYAPNYCGVSEIIAPISPYSCGCLGGIGEVISPIPYNPYCNIPEVPLPPCNAAYGVTETIAPIMPNCYGGVTEIISTLAPYNPGCYGGIPELISPYQYSPVGGVAQIIGPLSPCNSGCGFTELIAQITPNYYGGIPEIIGPINPYNSGCFANEMIANNPYCSCIPEIVAPCNAEIICSNPYQSYYPSIAELVTPVVPSCPGLNTCGPNCYCGVKEVVPSILPTPPPCGNIPYETYGTGFYY